MDAYAYRHAMRVLRLARLRGDRAAVLIIRARVDACTAIIPPLPVPDRPRCYRCGSPMRWHVGAEYVGWSHTGAGIVAPDGTRTYDGHAPALGPLGGRLAERRTA